MSYVSCYELVHNKLQNFLENGADGPSGVLRAMADWLDAESIEEVNDIAIHVGFDSDEGSFVEGTISYLSFD